MLRYTCGACAGRCRIRLTHRMSSSSARRSASTPASGVELDLEVLRAARVLARTGHWVSSDKPRRAAGRVPRRLFPPDAPNFDEWATLQRESAQRSMELVFDRLVAAGDRRWGVQRGPRHPPSVACRQSPERGSPSPCHAAALRGRRPVRCLARLRGLPRAARPGATPVARSGDRVVADRIRAHSDSERPPHQVRRGGAAAGPSSKDLCWAGRVSSHKLVELYRPPSRARRRWSSCAESRELARRVSREISWLDGGQGADVLQGRAFETGGVCPTSRWSTRFAPAGARERAGRSPERRLAGRAGPAPARVARSLPRPTGRGWGRGGRRACGSSRPLARLGQALAQRAPVVLFIDDVQWADAGSLDPCATPGGAGRMASAGSGGP